MSARDAEDVVNVAFDQWDEYATRVAAESVFHSTFGAFVRERLRAAGYALVPVEPTTEMLGACYAQAKAAFQAATGTIAEWKAMNSAAKDG